MTDDRPNILFIMTDQQRGDCLSIAGHPCLLTPNMDSIAGSGVRFSRAYVTCPSCVPARRSLMSGQHPPTTGMVGYQDGVEWEHPPPTLPGVLRDAGYQTALVGRSMHLHPPRKRYGFEEMIQHGWESDYHKWMLEHDPTAEGGHFGSGVMHNDWTARPWHLAETLHNTNWTVNQAMRWLERRDPSQPFFLCVSFIAPHPPLVPPQFYFDRYLRLPQPEPFIGDWATPPADEGLGDDVSSGRVHLTGERLRAARAGYYGLINHVDDQIRRLLNPVNGIQRMTGGNTVVIFTSDHGEMLGDHHLFRKQWSYEASANIPMLCSAPPRFELKRRSVVDAPVCLEDIMPTCLDFAGVDIPDTVEGRSMLPWMRGETPSWREYLHIEHAGHHQTVTDGRQKFIWLTGDGREQFFDLENDPNEMRNLIDDTDWQPRINEWRARLVSELTGREEGFVQDGALVPGRPYKAAMSHAAGRP